jgi:hypothetical protein
MRACGSDEFICPEGSVAPLRVASGYYTTDHWLEGCKPGKPLYAKRSKLLNA